MESLTGKGVQGSTLDLGNTNHSARSNPTISPITNQRIIDTGHVNANLMRPSGGEATLDQTDRPTDKGTQQTVTGQGRFAAMRDDRHAFTIVRVATNRSDNFTFDRIGQPPDQGLIGAFEAVSGELRRQTTMSGIGFGGHQQARGILIETMNDAGTADPANPGQRLPTMGQQSIDQG